MVFDLVTEIGNTASLYRTMVQIENTDQQLLDILFRLAPSQL